MRHQELFKLALSNEVALAEPVLKRHTPTILIAFFLLNMYNVQDTSNERKYEVCTLIKS